ncbi:phosphatidate cytidylyltransferase [Streptosporangium becharense]|uniref:Phosphatidate cytidylyltransferase n=1 Tax=Streptosporangium becharense TaxID=1816182 RepID=A0A7W9IDZ1_9ACTN|nr:phosphatidate cytidylyltransferase [Streptosporangium becharense]MBB2910071.1 phosphatidate cytidylyltransferase [Streptosporangium becharense]MBB5818974.1 phosphatidate cytidylyltransferase [Streptosporangium becharense]
MAGSSRTGRNLPVAVAVGLGLALVIIFSLYFVKELFLAVIIAAVGLGVTELVRSFAEREINVPLVPVLAGMAGMLTGAYWGGTSWLVGVFAMTVLVLLTWRMFQGTEGYVRDAAATVLVVVYPSLLAGFVTLLLAHPQEGADQVVVFIATTVASDIGGYFAGISLGKHKMAPVISPKKTWEGFAGSALACMAVGGWLVAWLLGADVWKGVLIGAVVVVFATLGDLVESVIKRDLGVKDMSSVLPGHGGMMDRLDSLVAAVIPVWILLALLV